ncbi:hypothetical protein E1B28_004620 [Marasmius oreades]|uniref:Cyclin N-terminal domain-containing protein n=1 Tax=Marasmius oreades TaxID=181124 RepID=A0A9P7UYZ5_9AGAR|nr:uncharacterized protein E1B28_004620 [Marasmius oreades]KAG7097254.1 hypothetical protein E1B28_004620 [Marasmius oreades]
MPVPVPCVPIQPAHPVIKPRPADNGKTNPFRNLTRTLPVSPTGPPPSFGTREEWISSLPSWRRSKPRRIWEEEANSERSWSHQDFHQGLAVADNASVIKGSRAEACLPPLSSQEPMIVQVQDDVDEMYPPHVIDHRGYCVQPHIDDGTYDNGMDAPSCDVEAVDDMYEGGASSEDESPSGSTGHDFGSSPLEPLTPFVDYVDEAATAGHYAADEYHYRCHQSKAAQFFSLPLIADVPQEPVPASAAVPDLVAPTATAGYRKLSEPLSEWIANFVWKACTTGSNVPSFITRSPISPTKPYPASPPSYLSTSVHSLLLSTLLQPSVVFLALWYIVKLPVFFGAVSLNVDNVKELWFRLGLLGERHSPDRDVMEANAPFRLIVLGCMLANKWLDDHTFSNKTWNTISNLPVQSLNKLESLALDIFHYDLSISPNEWSQWLSHLMSYHLSLSSPSHPQPISRPSTNPSSIIRMAIDEIVQAPAANNFDPAHPQPVFLGLEERKRERMQKEQATSPIEFDLDEDGPLREEYVPKRRISNSSTVRNKYHDHGEQLPWQMNQNGGKSLPPPARWSPAADEPIFRESNRMYNRYVAVQPTPGTAYPSFPSYQPVRDAYQSQWMFNAYANAEVQPGIGYSYEMPVLQHPPPPPVYNHCAPFLIPSLPMSRSRSQSLSHDQDPSQSRDHMRSFSQSRTDARHTEMHMCSLELPPLCQSADMGWGSTYAYHHAVFAPLPANYLWLRT